MNEHSKLAEAIAFFVFLPMVVLTRVAVGVPFLVIGRIWGAFDGVRARRKASKKAARLD